jgi:hypothetical protein
VHICSYPKAACFHRQPTVKPDTSYKPLGIISLSGAFALWTIVLCMAILVREDVCGEKHEIKSSPIIVKVFWRAVFVLLIARPGLHMRTFVGCQHGVFKKNINRLFDAH